MRAAVLFLALVCACTPVTVERWGYNAQKQPYAVAAKQVSPSGIHFDSSGQPISGALLDRLTGEVEACVKKSVDRTSFTVKIPLDWSLSCDGAQQLLHDDAPNSGCDAKGLPNTPGCPCRWRARIQWPNVIVATPSLYLYKDALTRFVTGSRNPWVDPALAACAHPTTAPLSKGDSP